MLIVPTEEFFRWEFVSRAGSFYQWLPVVCVVFPSILELFFDATADFHVKVFSHGHIASIKQSVKVGPEQ
jgi:hypothetical protein